MISGLIILFSFWSFVGLLIYGAVGNHVHGKLKKFVFSIACGPCGWFWGIIDWCLS